jgi:hypothetical protein
MWFLLAEMERKEIGEGQRRKRDHRGMAETWPNEFSRCKDVTNEKRLSRPFEGPHQMYSIYDLDPILPCGPVWL